MGGGWVCGWVRVGRVDAARVAQRAGQGGIACPPVAQGGLGGGAQASIVPHSSSRAPNQVRTNPDQVENWGAEKRGNREKRKEGVPTRTCLLPQVHTAATRPWGYVHTTGFPKSLWAGVGHDSKKRRGTQHTKRPRTVRGPPQEKEGEGKAPRPSPWFTKEEREDKGAREQRPPCGMAAELAGRACLFCCSGVGSLDNFARENKGGLSFGPLAGGYGDQT